MMQSTNIPTTLTIGIDLGDRKSHVCVLDAAGDIVEEGRIASTPKALRARFEGLAPSFQAQEEQVRTSAIRCRYRGRRRW